MGYFHRVSPCVFHTYVSLPQGSPGISYHGPWLFPNQTHLDDGSICEVDAVIQVALRHCAAFSEGPKIPQTHHVKLIPPVIFLPTGKSTQVVIFWRLEIGKQGSFEKYRFIRLLLAIIQPGSKWLVLMFQSFPRENHGCSIELNHPGSTTMELTFENKQLSWNWTSVQLQT